MSLALLKKACVNCKPSSIKTYWANIKALSRVAGHDETPAGAGWLNDKLLARIVAMPLNRYKRFTTAGVKALQMYKVKKPRWSKAMSEATEKYASLRESGKRTKREHENWPKDGYKALGTLARTLLSENRINAVTTNGTRVRPTQDRSSQASRPLARWKHWGDPRGPSTWLACTSRKAA